MKSPLKEGRNTDEIIEEKKTANSILRTISEYEVILS